MKYIILPDEALLRYPHQPFYVAHTLQNHPLLCLEKLLELCRFLPDDYIEYNLGELPIHLSPLDTPKNGLSAEETLLRIQTCKSWLVLKNVQQHPDYKALMNTCLDQIEADLNIAAHKNRRREAFIFISSPHSVTPFHVDPEHNFLLQIRGSKTIKQWDARDKEVLPDNVLEQKFYSTDTSYSVHRNIAYKDEFDAKSQNFCITPGQALYFPVHAPHWVQNGAEVSISLSITYRSEFSERCARLYRINGILRSKGLSPYPVNQTPIVDVIKDYAYGALSRLLVLKRAVFGRGG